MATPVYVYDTTKAPPRMLHLYDCPQITKGKSMLRPATDHEKQALAWCSSCARKL
jgi:hypothetical protein